LKRREFIEVTALTTTLILAGGLLNIAKSENVSSWNQQSANPGNHRMTGGRCSDYRMMEHGPDSRFEREIFGI
jgi:hypothetical protein